MTASWDNKGDIVIGNDVWIGYEAVIMAGGVPAKAIRKRYSEETITSLLELKWWNWPEDQTARNIHAIQTGHLKQLR